MNPWQTDEGGAYAAQRVPQQRIREKLDEYMSRRDYASAERHLLYWLQEARMGRDPRGELMVQNELIGHFRKTGNREGALRAIDGATALIAQLDYESTLSAGTTWINAATALSAFGENARALELFERARDVYASVPDADPQLMGGLCNNMALACAALGRWQQAEALYDEAMAHMGRAPHGALEQAITCLNRADLIAARDGMEAGERAICELLERAAELLRTPGIPHDGYYAFVCEKCAPSFEYYGFFIEAEALRGEAKAIYERT